MRAGNISINGGFVKSTGFEHSSGFGNSCASAPNTGGVIRITGGTLYPSVTSSEGFPDFNAEGGHVIITGGSVYTNGSFKGIGGTAWGNETALADGYNPDDPDDPNKVFMVTIDLSADMTAAGEPGDNLIESWNLKVGGVDYPYGAPTQLIDGKLYLWLPKSATKQTVSVDLSYRGSDGQPHPFDTLFRNPGQIDQLKRYEDFELPAEYLNSLVKPYDGLPFKTYEITPEHPLRTPEVLSYDENGEPSEYRWLTNTDDVTYRYRLYTERDGKPLGDEIDGGKNMPVNVGVMKFTMISREYSGSSDPALADFAEGYWGHRATGWCEITPIASQIRNITAEWADETDDGKRPGSVEHPSDQVLRVSAIIDRAATVNGKPDGEATKGTCKALRGRVQIYVDEKPVGEPLALVFAGDSDENGAPIPEGDPRVNAIAEDNGEGGEITRFSLAKAASEADFLLPVAAPDNRHRISIRFLPPDEGQQKAGIPANYLASAAPDEDGTVPRAEVLISPIDPNPSVTLEKDPDSTDPNAPQPTVSTDATGEPDDPGADPSKPCDRTYRGSIETTWGEPSDDNPHPGRVILKVKTDSTAPIHVTGANGSIFTADFLKDEAGEPVRGTDGTYTLVLDPTAVGQGTLTFKQEPNGAYTGTTWIYDVVVRPDVSTTPAPSLAKRAENLTHPNGPTRPGDRIRYTIEASNGTAGSLWTDVVISDPLPHCLELNEESLRLDNPGEGVTDLALSRAVTATATERGTFSLSEMNADKRSVLTVPVGSVPGGSKATVTFECVVRADAVGNEIAGTDLANVASATGTRPDPNDPDKPMPNPDDPTRPLPVDPAPTDPVTPPGPEHVVPLDPSEGDVSLAKTVENLTRTDGTTHVGDRLLYTVRLSHRGSESSVLYDAVISDPLPEGLEPVSGTLRLTNPDEPGNVTTVPDAAYNRASRTIAIAVGNLWGGQSWDLSFECTVSASAIGADTANVAFVHGTKPSQDPTRNPTETGDEPGTPSDPPQGPPTAQSDPTLPPTLVPDDPAANDVSISKAAENTSRSDGTTHVGDTVRYTIELANRAVGTGWIDAVIRDDVPRGLEPISGSIALTLPDGHLTAVDDTAYDPSTRILAATCGRLYGGQKVILTFDALVTEEAVDADIGNIARGYGSVPSQWNFDDPEPETGQPFSPPEGWDAWERDREKVVSDPAYPSGVTATGGVVNDEEAGDEKAAREKERATIAHRLAQTGDALAAAALLPVAAALAAGALGLANRRRGRRAQ